MRLYDTTEPWKFHLSAESHVTSLTRKPFILPCGWLTFAPAPALASALPDLCSCWTCPEILLSLAVLGLTLGCYAKVRRDISTLRHLRDQETLERKHLALQNEAQLRLHSMVLDQIQDAVTITDLQGVITYVNHAQCQLFGRSREDLIGNSVTTYGQDPARGATQQEIIDTTLSQGQWQGDVVNFNASGAPFTMHCRTSLIRDEAGTPVGMCGVGTNISERKRTELMLEARLRLSSLPSSLELEQLLQKVLDEAEQLTGSAIGFFHFLAEDQQTIWLQAWSANTLDTICSAEVHRLHYPVNQAGVWADCIREKRPAIHNDYQTLPHRKGLPPGHAPVVREMVAPIFRSNRIVAVFGVGNKNRDYDQADVDIVSTLGDMAWDLVLRKQAEDALWASLRAKEVLLREVHHRVKNNLAAIIGLLDLQRNAMPSDIGRGILTELSSRIRAMSLIHEKLYRSESLSEIDFQSYIQSLVSHLRTSFGSPHVRYDVQAQGVTLPLDLAVPCGMIVNELVTNALKHAFDPIANDPEANPPWILIALNHEGATITLTVADNGRGLPQDFSWRETKSLGLTLVRMLGEHQLGGKYTVAASRGAAFTLSFPIDSRRTA